MKEMNTILTTAGQGEHTEDDGLIHCNQCGQPRLLLVHLHHDAGDLSETSQLGCPIPPLSGNQLIVGVPLSHRQRLQNAVDRDALRQLLQTLLGKDRAWLGGIRHDSAGRQKYHPTRFHISFQFGALHKGHPSGT